MLATPKIRLYSDFHIATFADLAEEHGLSRSYYERHNTLSEQPLYDGIIGLYGEVDEFDLHPMYHETKQQFQDIHVSNIKSYLNRNRYLAYKIKKFRWNENYRALFHPRFIFRGEYPDEQSYEKAYKANKDVSITTYGAGDDPLQIYNRLNFLNKIKNRDFIISLRFIRKETLKDGESSYGGYRQHKNGGYFGTKFLEHEYLADEDAIKDGIYQFHILELVKPDNINVIRTENFIYVQSRNRANYEVYDIKDDRYFITHIQKNKEGQYYIGDAIHKIKFYDEGEFSIEQVDADLKAMVNEFESKRNAV